MTLVLHPMAIIPYLASGTGPKHGFGPATVGLIRHRIRVNRPDGAESKR